MTHVFLRPTGLHSPAMLRVVRALTEYAPDTVKIVDAAIQADIVVSHVICPDPTPPPSEIMIQYCWNSTGCPFDWLPRWQNAKMVWSYYDLGNPKGVNFYHAPLGVDKVFMGPVNGMPRDIPVMTSGCTTGPYAEAIYEVALAASSLGLRALHLGPSAVEGMPATPPGWSSVHGISDCDLAALYRRTEWVSGLRHVEGFELPVLEGLCCGARPIVFDRPDMTQWYEGHAAFVPECQGEELVDALTEVLRHVPVPVKESERQEVMRKFDWGVIARGFWERAGV